MTATKTEQSKDIAQDRQKQEQERTTEPKRERQKENTQ